MRRFKEQAKVFELYSHLPWYSRLRKFVVAVLDAYHLHLPESLVTNVLAVVVGIITGYGAVFFRWLISYWTNDTAPRVADIFGFLGMGALILVPVIGMTVVGILVHYFAPEARGHGVPEVMEAVAMKGGRIRGRVAVIKSLASSICIGFGGSVGREGPIVQIGAAVGSSISQFLKMSAERRRWLTACGAGAGIAATFNAPIAGVVFAMEVILHGSTIRSFTSIVLATVAGSVIGRIYFGNHAAFIVPAYKIVNIDEYLFYLALGVLSALVGVAYSRLVYLCEDGFTLLKIHPVLKASIGGLLIGLIIIFYPQVKGVGYDTITQILNGDVVINIMVILFVAKMLATAITLGSGGSGGIFAPSLFIGSCLGGTYGALLHEHYPDITGGQGAYAMVGMAAVFTAAARAPLTAIMILFELTGNYEIILPVMTAAVTATIVANHFQQESIYTFKLVRRGVRLRWGTDTDLLETIKVRDVMHTNIDSLHVGDTKKDFYNRFIEKQHQGFPILDEHGLLYGIVTFNDFCTAANLPDSTPVQKFCTRNLVTVFPTDDLSLSQRKMGIRDIGRLVVVDEDDPRRMVGIITRSDIIVAYEQARRRKKSDGLMAGGIDTG